MADLFISSSSNPASMRIRSTSSRIGLYSAVCDKNAGNQSAQRARIGRKEPTVSFFRKSESVPSKKFSAVVAGAERLLGPVFAWYYWLQRIWHWNHTTHEIWRKTLPMFLQEVEY